MVCVKCIYKWICMRPKVVPKYYGKKRGTECIWKGQVYKIFPWLLNPITIPILKFPTEMKVLYAPSSCLLNKSPQEVNGEKQAMSYCLDAPKWHVAFCRLECPVLKQLRAVDGGGHRLTRLYVMHAHESSAHCPLTAYEVHVWTNGHPFPSSTAVCSTSPYFCLPGLGLSCWTTLSEHFMPQQHSLYALRERCSVEDEGGRGSPESPVAASARVIRTEVVRWEPTGNMLTSHGLRAAYEPSVGQSSCR